MLIPNISELFQLSTWRRYARIEFVLLKWLIRILSASVEVFLRCNFGTRYLPMLIAAFFCCVLAAGFAGVASATSLLLLVFFALIIRHTFESLTRSHRGFPMPHSYSAGDSWQIWQRLSLRQTTVQRYIEPVLCFFVGVALDMLGDTFASVWFKSAAVALFIKEQIIRIQMARRILAATDARLDAQQLSAGINQHLNPSRHDSQQAHRARLSHHPRS